MKPRDTANEILDIIQHSELLYEESFGRYENVKHNLLTLCSKLITSEPSYGHAERIHKLTEREDNGNDRND